jgi:hypothetical protein
MYRVTTLFSGTYVAGGGIQQFHFIEGGGTALQALAAAKAFWAACSGFLVAGTIGITQGTVETVDELTGQVTAVTAGTNGTTSFTGGSEAMAPQVQGLVQWRSGIFADGREIRGRTFLPAMMESLNTLGAPAESLVTAVGVAAAALIADANSGLCVWRRPRVERPQVGVPGDRWYLPAQSARVGTHAVVSSGAMWSKWATLRSRRD